jgi:hypothetical protein
MMDALRNCLLSVRANILIQIWSAKFVRSSISTGPNYLDRKVVPKNVELVSGWHGSIAVPTTLPVRTDEVIE